MKIDKIIEELQKYREEHGNVEVLNIMSDEETISVICEAFDDDKID